MQLYEQGAQALARELGVPDLGLRVLSIDETFSPPAIDSEIAPPAPPDFGGAVLPALPTTPQAIIASLQKVGVDFSVPEADLLEWLANREFTPYPAISEALVAMIGGKRLKKPVFIDVIVWNYEHSTGASSPRKVAEVDPLSLRAAILEGYNTRYGETIANYEGIVVNVQ